jgi:hypothetical protein
MDRKYFYFNSRINTKNWLLKCLWHLYPGVKLKSKAKQNLSLPCFYFAEHFAILPAFSNLQV